jgi:uncharacterized protein (DUF169 family)
MLPCWESRVFGALQDEEIAFSMPRLRFETVLGRLDATEERGHRFPVATSMWLP